MFNIRRSAFRGFFHLIVTRIDIADAQLTKLGIERCARCTRFGEERIYFSRFINKPFLFENVGRCGVTSKIIHVATVTRFFASETVCSRKSQLIQFIIHNRNLQVKTLLDFFFLKAFFNYSKLTFFFNLKNMCLCLLIWHLFKI